MTGIIGILLVFAMYRDRQRIHSKRQLKERAIVRAIIVASTVFVLAGTCVTTFQEIKKAPYRRASYEHMTELILDYENADEAELAAALEWHKAPETMYTAINILKDKKLNVFRTMGIAR